MSRKSNFIIASLAVFLLAIILIFSAYAWFIKKQQRVLNGTARPTFPYSDYSIEELNKLYPQYLNVDVKTTRAPEQTHKMFMERLKAGDLDGAVECCFMKGDWVEMKEFFQGVKDKGMWNLMVGDLGDIKQDMMLDTMATYEYSGTLKGEKTANFIEFIKNSDGIWLIKSL